MVLEETAHILHVPVWLLRGILGPLVYPGLVAVLGTVLFLLWAERKMAARVQQRVGPYYVSPRLHGALQLIADGTRFALQEIIIHVETDRTMFVLSPILAFTFLVLPFTVLPGGPGIYGFHSEFSIIILYALLTLAPITVILMGWASSNKFSMIGAGREALLIISGELTLGIAMLSAAAMYGTLDFVKAVEKQTETGVIGLISNPLAALLFFLAMLLLTDRLPFDIVLGEQEIVQGPYTEYSGVLYALTMAIDYVKLYALSFAFTLLFLGGWAPFSSPLWGSISVYVKSLLVMLFSVFLRAVYGRMRLDHAMNLFWAKLFPLGFASLVIAIIAHVIYA
jgi:NADH:ubiquinone oxidoreductase subunit H